MSYFAGQPDLAPRKVIDIAVGIIIGLRRCSEEEAFAEIARVVHRTGVPLSKVAAALVALASDSQSPPAQLGEAKRLWSDLMPWPDGSQVETPR